MKIISLHHWSAIGLATILMFATWQLWPQLKSTESTLELRANQPGANLPDGFFILQHLDANGIAFNSITQKNKTLLIKFNSDVQSEAAKSVLCKILPDGFVIASPGEGHSSQADS